MTIRVAHFVNPTFGVVFSGHTHYLFSLLSGWKDKEISLDLLGTQIKPLNLNSGENLYQLPSGSLWSKPEKQSRGDRIQWSLKLLMTLIANYNEYDIVHFHSLCWGALLSPMILHPFGKKVVFTMSLLGNDNPGYIYQQIRGPWQVSMLQQFDGAIGISPALVKDAQRYNLRNVICLPNFLAIPQLEKTPTPDLYAAARSKLKIPPNKIVLLFVGSVINRKGVDILIDSFIELSGKYSNLWLLVVGPNKKEEFPKIDEIYVLKLKNNIQKARLEDRTIWAGMIKEQSQLIDYYYAADIFVFPTRNEGLGNVLIEASAAGLPIVATHLKGVTDEVVSNCMSGYLVEPDRSDLFARHIEKIIEDKAKSQKMGVYGRKITLEKFGFDIYCHRLKTFYLDLLR